MRNILLTATEGVGSRACSTFPTGSLPARAGLSRHRAPDRHKKALSASPGARLRRWRQSAGNRAGPAPVAESFHGSTTVYDNPLVTRYASREMARLWGPQRKFSTWRRLWVALAEAQHELGLLADDGRTPRIRADQLAELRAAPRRHRLRPGRRLRDAAAPRRDGPHPHLRRGRPGGPRHHPPRRHQLLRHRQHRPDPDARGPATCCATGWSASSTPWPAFAEQLARPGRRWASRTSSRPS